MSQSTEDRLNKIELELAHLQHDYDAQNEIILANNQKLMELENSIRELVRRLATLQPPEEKRSLEDDRPPHY